jgi:hypothetical protein
MDDNDREERAMARARERAATTPTGIGAAYLGDVTNRDRGGWQGIVAVSDGQQDVILTVAVAGHNGFRGMPVEDAAIAALVERHAGSFPRESRLRDLAQAPSDGPGLMLDRLYPDDWPQVRRRG